MTSTFLVLPRVHSQVHVFVRASTGDGLINQPDQAQGESLNTQSGVVVPILSELIIRAVRILAQKNPVRELHVLPLPPATMAGLTRWKETIHFDHPPAMLLQFARQQVQQFAQRGVRE